MRQAVKRVPEDVPVTTMISRKPIRNALVSCVEKADYDLLVMGSRGRGALSASLLGSVSHYALNHVPIPVLIVHADPDRRLADADLSSAAPIARPRKPTGPRARRRSRSSAGVVARAAALVRPRHRHSRRVSHAGRISATAASTMSSSGGSSTFGSGIWRCDERV